MRVVITNTVALNGGDAAILMGVAKLLRAAFGGETQCVVFDSQPEVAKRHYPELDFRELWHARATRRGGRRWRKLRRAYHLGRVRLAATCLRRGWGSLTNLLLDTEERRALEAWWTADVVVSTGGTYLVEHYSLKPRLFEFELARTLGKPLILFTQSLGPFVTAENKRGVRVALDHASLVLVRDEASKRHLEELQVPDRKIRLAADAAFALKAKFAPPPAGGPLRVAVSVREWAYFKDGTRGQGMGRFLEAIAALTRHLVEKHGAEVTFLSTCQGIPEYRYDDSKIAAALVETLPESIRPRVAVNRGFHRPEKLVELLQGFDLVVATRMHMAILALVAGTPVVPIAYEFKTEELFARLGLGAWVQDIEKVSADTLTKCIDAFLEQLPAIRKALPALVAVERARAEAAMEMVKAGYEAR